MGKCIRLNGKKTLQNIIGKGKNILLFGSEGFGLKNQSLKKSDFIFKININKNIESLNISNSVSVVCHYINNELKNAN